MQSEGPWTGGVTPKSVILRSQANDQPKHVKILRVCLCQNLKSLSIEPYGTHRGTTHDPEPTRILDLQRSFESSGAKAATDLCFVELKRLKWRKQRIFGRSLAVRQRRDASPNRATRRNLRVCWAPLEMQAVWVASPPTRSVLNQSYI